MKNITRIIITILLAVLARPCHAQFVTVNNGSFERDGKPYYFVGTNFWYGPILASEGEGGNRKRLKKELDLLKKTGINNLRILVGSDGIAGPRAKVRPTLQQAPGVYNDTILAGLDYLLAELGKRHMVAVLYLNNSWEWSGGYSFYLEHAGAGKAVIPEESGYDKYQEQVRQFATNKKAQQLFFDYTRFIISRTNRYTGKKYINDPAIMSWQIGNEPRAFASELLPDFEKWLSEASALIRSIDPNHLISIGSEGAFGCEGSYETWEHICSDRNIDYCNIHLWPLNWGWTKKDSVLESVERACNNAQDYIDRHLAIATKINKPLVMEEFGYPRDNYKFGLGTPTVARDKFYRYVFNLVYQNAKKHEPFSGLNFWGWGGYAKPKHERWIDGDDYSGDPAQEEQGLNSVFASDKSTLKIIKEYCGKLSKVK